MTNFAQALHKWRISYGSDSGGGLFPVNGFSPPPDPQQPRINLAGPKEGRIMNPIDSVQKIPTLPTFHRTNFAISRKTFCHDRQNFPKERVKVENVSSITRHQKKGLTNEGKHIFMKSTILGKTKGRTMIGDPSPYQNVSFAE